VRRRTVTGNPATDGSPDGVAPEVRLNRPIWFYVLRRAARNFLSHRGTDLAAALTYYAVFAIGPALIALVSALGILGRSDQVLAAIFRVVGELAPEGAVQTAEPVIDRITSSTAVGLGLALGLAGALWSTSAYVGAFGRTMNTVFQVEEGRPIWKLRPLNLLLTTILLTLVALVATAMVLSGPIAGAIGRGVGLADETVRAWNTLKWPVVLLLVVVVVTLLYYATPNVRRPRVRLLSAGAVVAIGAWVGASVGLAFYVSRFGTYDATYGSLAGVVVFLLWLWVTNVALVFGAELDAEIERARQLLAGIPAEESLQLPLRDRSALEKRVRREARAIAVGRALRLRAQARAGEERPAGRDVPGPPPGVAPDAPGSTPPQNDPR
jgi:membrane protein